MDNKKKQHYVPQLRLRQFAYDKKQEYVWVLDKNQKSIRESRIKDVCEENYFYKIPISEMLRKQELKEDDYKLLDDSCFKDTGKHINELTDEELNDMDYSVENYFSDFIEPCLSKFIDDIIKKANSIGSKSIVFPRYFIDEDNKHDFAWFIAKEFIRTKHHRDIMSNMMEKTYQKMIPIIAQFNGMNIDAKDVEVKYSKEQIKFMHASSIFNDKTCEKFASVFFSHIWILIENNTKEPFCCVDNTFMMEPTEEIPPFFGYGLASYGMILTMPLSPKYALVMFDRTKFKERLTLDKTIISVDNVKIIENINLGLIHSSYKFVIFNKESAAKKYKSKCDDIPELYKEASKGEVY